MTIICTSLYIKLPSLGDIPLIIFVESLSVNSVESGYESDTEPLLATGYGMILSLPRNFPLSTILIIQFPHSNYKS